VQVIIVLFACLFAKCFSSNTPFPPQVVFVNGQYTGTFSFGQSNQATVGIEYLFSGSSYNYHRQTSFTFQGFVETMDCWMVSNGVNIDVYNTQDQSSCSHDSYTNTTRKCTNWQQNGNIFNQQCTSSSFLETTTLVLDVNNFVLGMIFNQSRSGDVDLVTRVTISKNIPIPPSQNDFNLPSSCTTTVYK